MSKEDRAADAAERVKLAIVECADTRRLYGYFHPRLDVTATLRRVALFAHGSGKRKLTLEERAAALEVLHYRMDLYAEDFRMGRVGGAA